MFERFTKAARQAVVAAQYEARELRHEKIDSTHVLLGLVDGEGDAAAAALRAQGVSQSDLRARVARRHDPDAHALDAEALAAIGIDLDQVREATEAGFGPGALDKKPGRGRKGHIPFTPDAKKVLELSLRHAIRLKQHRISTGHILLGLLHDEDNPAARILRDAGAEPTVLRDDVTRRLRAEAA